MMVMKMQTLDTIQTQPCLSTSKGDDSAAPGEVSSTEVGGNMLCLRVCSKLVSCSVLMGSHCLHPRRGFPSRRDTPSLWMGGLSRQRSDRLGYASSNLEQRVQ